MHDSRYGKQNNFIIGNNIHLSSINSKPIIHSSDQIPLTPRTVHQNQYSRNNYKSYKEKKNSHSQYKFTNHSNPLNQLSFTTVDHPYVSQEKQRHNYNSGHFNSQHLNSCNSKNLDTECKSTNKWINNSNNNIKQTYLNSGSKQHIVDQARLIIPNRGHQRLKIGCNHLHQRKQLQNDSLINTQNNIEPKQMRTMGMNITEHINSFAFDSEHQYKLSKMDNNSSSCQTTRGYLDAYNNKSNKKQCSNISYTQYKKKKTKENLGRRMVEDKKNQCQTQRTYRNCQDSQVSINTSRIRYRQLNRSPYANEQHREVAPYDPSDIIKKHQKIKQRISNLERKTPKKAGTPKRYSSPLHYSPGNQERMEHTLWESEQLHSEWNGGKWGVKESKQRKEQKPQKYRVQRQKVKQRLEDIREESSEIEIIQELNNRINHKLESIINQYS